MYSMIQRLKHLRSVTYLSDLPVDKGFWLKLSSGSIRIGHGINRTIVLYFSDDSIKTTVRSAPIYSDPDVVEPLNHMLEYKG
jgi:hypothetical protein